MQSSVRPREFQGNSANRLACGVQKQPGYSQNLIFLKVISAKTTFVFVGVGTGYAVLHKNTSYMVPNCSEPLFCCRGHIFIEKMPS
jgi:hypothetical protein